MKETKEMKCGDHRYYYAPKDGELYPYECVVLSFGTDKVDGRTCYTWVNVKFVEDEKEVVFHNGDITKLEYYKRR